MSDAFGIQVLQDERTPPGHAIIRVSGVEQAPLDEHFEIRRAEDHGVPVGTDWPTGPRDPVASNWDPETKVWEMTIGPEIVNPILGGTRVVVNLLGLGRQEQLSWPDDLVLAAASGRRWARPTRREIKTVVPPGKDTSERDRRRQAEAEAQRRQEEERRQAEAERRRQKEEEQRRSAEAERQRREEEGRLQAEAEQQKSEAEKRSREEEERKQAEAERQQRLDEERRAAEEKQKRLDEEKTRALDETKRDDRRGSQNRLGLWLGLTGGVLAIAGVVAWLLWPRPIPPPQIEPTPLPAPTAAPSASPLEEAQRFLQTNPSADQIHAKGLEFQGRGEVGPAAVLFRKAADEPLKHGPSAHALGRLYDPSDFSPQGSAKPRATQIPEANPLFAATWYQRAAEYGDESAKQDLERLLEWAKTAASGGDSAAEEILRKFMP
jgi:hypothetical protein